MGQTGNPFRPWEVGTDPKPNPFVNSDEEEDDDDTGNPNVARNPKNPNPFIDSDEDDDDDDLSAAALKAPGRVRVIL